MDETIGLTAVLGLVGYFLKLTFMPEVRTVRRILGSKNICLDIEPKEIDPFYKHDQNRSTCINFFYRRMGINLSYYICMSLTVVTLIFGLPTFVQNFENPFAQSAPESKQVSKPVVQQFDSNKISETTILVVETDGTYVIKQLPAFAEISIITPDGQFIPVFGGNNIIFAFLFFGLMLALICSVLAGALKQPES
jgi:hypothetical protein